MTLNLAYRVPILNRIGVLKKYQKMFDQIELEIDAVIWIILSLLFAAVAGATFYFYLPGFLLIGLGTTIVVLDMMLGYPYIKAIQRVDRIEENLPDALKQMSDTLKSGGTVEFALREVAYSEYGPLKKELLEILRKLEEGENFSNALMTLSENVDSRTVNRTVTIIIDSIKAGAGLAEILDEISDDVRETHKIGRERKTRTLLQVIFMTAAGGVVAPMIFGFVGTISNVLINAAAAIGKPEERLTAQKAADTINLGIQIYMVAQVIAASAMMALMREGRLSKTIIYFPIILFIAIVSYTFSSAFSRALVGGA